MTTMCWEAEQLDSQVFSNIKYRTVHVAVMSIQNNKGPSWQSVIIEMWCKNLQNSSFVMLPFIFMPKMLPLGR
jgi:hypothetical protein